MTSLQRSETPADRRRWDQFEAFELQLAHRAATLSLLLLAAAIACAVKNTGPFGHFLAASFVCADAALAATALAWWTQRRLRHPTRQSLGLTLFSLTLLALSLTLYILGKQSQLQPLLNWFVSLLPPP